MSDECDREGRPADPGPRLSMYVQPNSFDSGRGSCDPPRVLLPPISVFVIHVFRAKANPSDASPSPSPGVPWIA